MPERLLIIADDFTGACDTGVQASRHGLSVRVAQALPSTLEPNISYALDTQARNLAPDDADFRLSSLLKAEAVRSFPRVFLKVDSLLRGNIATHLNAAIVAYEPDIVLFAPALIRQGRTTIDGVQYLNGVPLCDTEAARDLRSPLREDQLMEILNRVIGKEETAKQIGISQLYQGGFICKEVKLYALDAKSDRDLEEIVKQGLAYSGRVLWVGTSGLARALLSQLLPAPPVLATIGSLSPVAQEQADRCRRNGASLIELSAEMLLDNETYNKLINQAVAYLMQGRDVVLLCRPPQQQTKNLQQEAPLICTILGKLTAQIAGQVQISGLFLSGGDTAASTVQALGAQASSLLSETLPGMPLMQVAGGPLDGLRVITKAGAFGQPDDIVWAIDKLKEGMRR